MITRIGERERSKNRFYSSSFITRIKEREREVKIDKRKKLINNKKLAIVYNE